MIQKMILGVLTVIYFSNLMASEVTDLEITGFKIVESSDEMMKLRFRDEKPFLMTKIKFTSEDQAKNFCKQQNLNLDLQGVNKALLLAMSGAAILNDEIHKAISFKIDDQNSGIAAWTGQKNQVIVIWNGRGTSTEVLSMDELSSINTKLEEPVQLSFSAICE